MFLHENTLPSSPNQTHAPALLQSDNIIAKMLANSHGMAVIERRAPHFVQSLNRYAVPLYLGVDSNEAFAMYYPCWSLQWLIAHMATLSAQGVKTFYLDVQWLPSARQQWQSDWAEFLVSPQQRLPETLRLQFLNRGEPEKRAYGLGCIQFLEAAKRYGFQVKMLDYATEANQLNQSPDKWVALLSEPNSASIESVLQETGAASIQVAEDYTLRPTVIEPWAGDVTQRHYVLSTIPQQNLSQEQRSQRLALPNTFFIHGRPNNQTLELCYRGPERWQNILSVPIYFDNQNRVYFLDQQLQPWGNIGQGPFSSLTEISFALENRFKLFRVTVSPNPDWGAPTQRYDVPRILTNDIVLSFVNALPVENEDVLKHWSHHRAELLREATPVHLFLAKARPALPLLPAGISLSEALQKLLNAVPGLVVGELHAYSSARQFLIDSMPLLAQNGVKTLYLEHFLTDVHQWALDAFWHTGVLPPSLERHINNVDPSGVLRRLMERALEHDIRLIAIDNLASQYVISDDSSEINIDPGRIIATNFLAKQIIDHQQSQPQAGKWVALAGTAHISRYNGVHGIAELTGALSLRIDSPDIDSTIRPDYGLWQELSGVYAGVWTQTDFTLNPPHEVLSEAALDARLEQVGDFLIHKLPAVANLELRYRTRENEVQVLPIKRDGERFYLDHSGFGRIIHQRRYHSPNELACDLNQYLQMTRVRVSVSSLKNADGSVRNPAIERLYKASLFADYLGFIDVGSLNQQLLQAPIGTFFIRYLDDTGTTLECRYLTRTGEIVSLPILRKDDKVYVDHLPWKDKDINRILYRNEADLSMELRNRNMQQLRFIISMDDIQSAYGVEQFKFGQRNWHQEIKQLNLSRSTPYEIQNILWHFAHSLSPRRRGALMEAVHTLQNQHVTRWQNNCVSLGGKVIALSTQYVPLQIVRWDNTIHAAQSALFAGVWLHAVQTRQPRNINDYFTKVITISLSPQAEAATQLFFKTALLEWTHNGADKKFASHPDSSGLTIQGVIAALSQVTQTAAFELSLGKHVFTLGVSTDGTMPSYLVADLNHGYVEFSSLPALQQALDLSYHSLQTLYTEQYHPASFTLRQYRSDLPEQRLLPSALDVDASVPLRLKDLVYQPTALLPQAVLPPPSNASLNRGSRYTQQIILQLGQSEAEQFTARSLYQKNAAISIWLKWDAQFQTWRTGSPSSAATMPTLDENSRIIVLGHGHRTLQDFRLEDVDGQRLAQMIAPLMPKHRPIGRLALLGCHVAEPTIVNSGILTQGFIVDLLNGLKRQQRLVNSVSARPDFAAVDAAGHRFSGRLKLDGSGLDWQKSPNDKWLFWQNSANALVHYQRAYNVDNSTTVTLNLDQPHILFDSLGDFTPSPGNTTGLARYHNKTLPSLVAPNLPVGHTTQLALGSGLRLYGAYRALSSARHNFHEGKVGAGVVDLLGVGNNLLAEGVERAMTPVIQRSLERTWSGLVNNKRPPLWFKLTPKSLQSVETGVVNMLRTSGSWAHNTARHFAKGLYRAGGMLLGAVLTLPFDIYNAAHSFSQSQQLTGKARQDALVGGSLAISSAALTTALALGALLSAKFAAVAGPIGLAAGIILIVGTQIYSAVRQVENIEEYIQLSGWEKLQLGWRFFMGLPANKEIMLRVLAGQSQQDLLGKIKNNYQHFLNQQTSIDRIVYPSPSVQIRCYQQQRLDKEDMKKFFLERLLRTEHDMVPKEDHAHWHIGQKHSDNQQWNDRTHAYVTTREDHELFIQDSDDVVDYSAGLLPSSALQALRTPSADMTQKAGGAVLLQFGNGHDTLTGLATQTNIFIGGSGNKTLYGGEKDDLFRLNATPDFKTDIDLHYERARYAQAQRIADYRYHFDGKEGSDTLLLDTLFEHSQDYCGYLIDLEIGTISVIARSNKAVKQLGSLRNIEHIQQDSPSSYSAHKLCGNDQNNTLVGKSHDKLYGRKGIDTLKLTGQALGDGGEGVDLYQVTLQNGDHVVISDANLSSEAQEEASTIYLEQIALSHLKDWQIDGEHLVLVFQGGAKLSFHGVYQRIDQNTRILKNDRFVLYTHDGFILRPLLPERIVSPHVFTRFNISLCYFKQGDAQHRKEQGIMLDLAQRQVVRDGHTVKLDSRYRLMAQDTIYDDIIILPPKEQYAITSQQGHDQIKTGGSEFSLAIGNGAGTVTLQTMALVAGQAAPVGVVTLNTHLEQTRFSIDGDDLVISAPLLDAEGQSIGQTKSLRHLQAVSHTPQSSFSLMDLAGNTLSWVLDEEGKKINSYTYLANAQGGPLHSREATSNQLFGSAANDHFIARHPGTWMHGAGGMDHYDIQGPLGDYYIDNSPHTLSWHALSWRLPNETLYLSAFRRHNDLLLSAWVDPQQQGSSAQTGRVVYLNYFVGHSPNLSLTLTFNNKAAWMLSPQQLSQATQNVVRLEEDDILDLRIKDIRLMQQSVLFDQSKIQQTANRLTETINQFSASSDSFYSPPPSNTAFETQLAVAGN